MSNAIVVPDTFRGPASTVFQAETPDDLSGGITGGYGLLKYRGKVWSIQHHGTSMNLMRDDGDGPRGSIDVVILKANAQLSKTWYEGGWDENSNNPPDCASANGLVPDQGVPKKQSETCATCPRNAWGSAPNGGKGKACGDHRRMAVVPMTDLRNEALGGPLLLRCPAASLQDMSAFDSRYKAMGYPYYTMAVKIGFDAQESFPKFTFAAIRPLTDDEAKVVVEMRNSPETARVVSETTAPARAAIAAPAAGPAFLEAPPPNAVQPQVAAQPVAPVAAGPAPAPVAPAPVAQPAPEVGAGHVAPNANGAAVPAEPVRPAPAPAAAQPAAVNAGGFGPAATTAAPATAPAAKPAAKMTGFGVAAPVTPEVTQPVQQVAQPQVPAQPSAAPGVVTAFEGSIDDRLNALLSE